MTTYLLESGLSLLALLELYKLLLENQPMHQLKRLYLLGTLAVSFLAPLLTIEVPLPEPTTKPAAITLFRPTKNSPIEAVADTTESTVTYWLWLYGAGTLLMLIRFGSNLTRLIGRVHRYPTRAFQGATLVLLPGEVLPHTFLRYLFVSKDAFEQGTLEPELLTHELTHIRQRHSLDVLLIELVLCVGWVNPLLFWLRQAMQRNHEFLADEAVNATYGNVPGYQQLLLAKLTHATALPALVSTLTFQTTKQRLLMMTKHASPARTTLAGLVMALLFSTLTFLLTVRTIAQQTPAKATAANPAPSVSRQLTVDEIERRFGDKLVNGSSQEIKTVMPFKDLTPEQKSRVVLLQPDSRKTPTESEWQAFHNSKKYGIWVDEKRRRDNPLAKYKRTDIVHFWSSYVHKNARQPEGYTNQLELYTEVGYQEMIRQWEEKPWLHLMTKEQLEKRQNPKTGK